jgi:hypothetical protein
LRGARGECGGGTKAAILVTNSKGVKTSSRSRLPLAHPPVANLLKGMDGDAMNALLCGAGHNLRKILKKLRLFCAQNGIEYKKLVELIRSQRHLLADAIECFKADLFGVKLNVDLSPSGDTCKNSKT